MIAATLEGNDLRFSHIFLLTHSLAPHQHTQLTKSPLKCVERISFLKKFNPQRETSVESLLLSSVLSGTGIGTHSWPTAVAQVSLSASGLVKDPTGP